MANFLVLLQAVAYWATLAESQLHPKKPAAYVQLPSLRDRARIQDGWQQERIARIPDLLRKYEVDAWLMSQREHAEDTIWWSIKNATAFDSHRRTVILFHTGTESLSGHPNPLVWVDNTGEVWPEMQEVFREYDPKRIAINVDQDIAFAGGLHAGELATMIGQLGAEWMGRTVNVPMLAVEYVATKMASQLEYYSKLQEITWALLEEGFSHKVIEVGKTTTEDLSWWFREKMQEQNVTTWNQPRVSVIIPESFPGWEGTDDVIQEGDLLHIDFGITAMGLNTDTQHMAYVLRTSNASGEAESDAPKGLKEGLKKSNRMQEVVLENMQAGIDGQIYCHPIGDWGHDAGAVMGFTNLPTHVPILGELPILPNTYYSIELYAYHHVPERDETLRFRQEENVYWNEDSQSWEFVRGRQERFHLVDGRKRKQDAPSTYNLKQKTFS
ncbi:hypothetical protein BD779DRAFT_404541 [Infundibulicybe gibba]|nr:hypothetical protein BD779DRAFT_404541 [Infundibulicybe gibba]